MSESQTPPTGEAPQPAPSGPETTPKVPDGFTQVRTEDYASTERLANQARGQAQIINPLVTAGIKTPEDVAALIADRATLAELRAVNVDVSQLVGSLSGGSQPAPEPTQTPVDAVTREEFTTARAFDRAEVVHESQTQGQDERITVLVNELAGKDASEFHKNSVAATVKDIMLRESYFYPEGHSLYRKENGYIQPLDAAAWAKVETDARAGYGGKPAQKVTAPAMVGNGGGQGPGATQSSESTPFQSLPQEDQLAEAQKIVDELNGTVGTTV